MSLTASPAVHNVLKGVQGCIAALALYCLLYPADTAKLLPPELASRFLAITTVVSAALPGLIGKLKQAAGEQGLTGPPGPTGASGAQGDTGPRGLTGPRG